MKHRERKRAKILSRTAGHSDADHFPDVRKMIPMPKGAKKELISCFIPGFPIVVLL